MKKGLKEEEEEVANALTAAAKLMYVSTDRQTDRQTDKFDKTISKQCSEPNVPLADFQTLCVSVSFVAVVVFFSDSFLSIRILLI